VIVSVLDERIYEMTNENNEIDPDYYYKVLGPSGREYDAKLLSIDWYSNLVFYKIEGENFPVPEFGNSDELESGEKIIICGNASGEYQNVYSQGIVQENDRGFSLLNSELSSSEKMEGAIMTNTEISNRNIGGPVIDFNGTMVGLANQIEKDGEYVGFIMPISNIRSSIEEMIRNKKIERPYFGAYYLSIDREISILNHLPMKNGALIYSFSGQQGLAVIKNSPADKAGIKIGDVITEVNGEEINLKRSLSSVIADSKSGDELELKIFRNGEEKTLEAVLK
nr:PDZ domain-containing protein [Patescibacteria group bacterium]